MANPFVQKEDKHWRDRRYIVGNAECSTQGRAKRDLFGFIDRVYIGPEGRMVFAQITSQDNMGARVHKILSESTGHGKERVRMAEIARRLLLTWPNRLMVVGWELNEKRWRYERAERELDLQEIHAALGMS